MKCKAFDAFLREMNQKPQNQKKWLQDKRLTNLEKKIISGHLLIRNNQNLEVVKEMAVIGNSDIEFVNAHKEMLMGIAYNNLSEYHKAESHLKAAVELMSELQLPYYEFISSFNLFILNSNQQNFPAMESLLNRMKAIKLETKLQELRLLRCEFMYAVDTDKDELALSLIDKTATEKQHFAESDLISQLVCEFMFFVKVEDLDRARVCLTEMKLHRKFQLSENFNYMKKLLDHLTDNVPIYAYDKDFKEYPILLHQLKVIQALEAAENEAALASWKVLNSLMPQTFQNPLEYVGTKTLFSLCLEKYEKGSVVLTLDENLGTLEERLLTLLTNAKAALPKPLIYEILWGNPPESKDDLAKLTRLTNRLRSKHGIDVKSRKGTYYVAPGVLNKAG